MRQQVIDNAASLYKDPIPVPFLFPRYPEKIHYPLIEGTSYRYDGIAEGLFTLDKNWRCIYASTSFLRLLDKKSHDLVGSQVWEIFPELEATALGSIYKCSMHDGMPRILVDYIPAFSGWFRVSITPTAEGIDTIIQHHTKSTSERHPSYTSEEKYRTLFNSIDESFCLVEVLFDTYNRPYDYRFLETNEAFKQQTDIENAVGRTMREIAPLHENHWFEIYGHVALTGESIRFENHAEQLHRWYEVYAFRMGAAEQRQVAILFKDITERKRMEHLKDDFISTASHELNTPLTGIKAYTQLLTRELQKAGDKRNTALAKKLHHHVERMVNLVNNLLDTSNITKGEFPLTKERFDINDLVGERINEFRLLNQYHQIILNTKPVRPVFADRQRIGQALGNIITNAIKYSPPTGKITVSVSDVDEKFLKISIEDHGVGIPAPSLTNVFDRFFRAGSADMPTYPGMGLGLYITAQIIKHHGGTITADNKPDKGAVFSFTLPYD
ncbi:PAS domain-containing protein [Parapedobacter luteus]|uniref:histidine kinase n=1 Tax=Parapedobacter luteus TaxID=623280 RepID=A0A1T5EEA0_9SPHI|nr:ATP-binding protein [Parapedobacter luteus]SKB82312.1 PAS domain-containing protein [Parapedobacter luteus]